jgi:hypothetical protein
MSHAEEFTCQHCKKPVTRRKSLAITPSDEKFGEFVAAVDKHRKPITLKPFPRRHRGKCPE